MYYGIDLKEGKLDQNKPGEKAAPTPTPTKQDPPKAAAKEQLKHLTDSSKKNNKTTKKVTEPEEAKEGEKKEEVKKDETPQEAEKTEEKVEEKKEEKKPEEKVEEKKVEEKPAEINLVTPLKALVEYVKWDHADASYYLKEIMWTFLNYVKYVKNRFFFQCLSNVRPILELLSQFQCRGIEFLVLG